MRWQHYTCPSFFSIPFLYWALTFFSFDTIFCKPTSGYSLLISLSLHIKRQKQIKNKQYICAHLCMWHFKVHTHTIIIVVCKILCKHGRAAPQWEWCQPQSSQEWEILGHRDSVSLTYSITYSITCSIIYSLLPSNVNNQDGYKREVR